MAIIKLQSSDGIIFSIDVEIVQCSATIKTMLDHLGIDKDDEEEPIPLPVIHSNILSKIIEWAKHHKDDPPYKETEVNVQKRTDDISVWDADFFKMDQATLLDIIEAANYLDIKPIVDTVCKTIANMMKGKTPEELRAQFNIENDWTPEEEKKMYSMFM